MIKIRERIKNRVCTISNHLNSVNCLILAISVAVGIFSSMLFSMVNFTDNCNNISNKLLRLHIIANSDSQEDQDLKLKVRDAILAIRDDTLSDADDLDTAEILVNKNLKKITSTAKKVIADNGYDYSVSSGLVNMYFDTRTYDDLTIPSGYYDALRITIGEGKGKNWWCVLFPSMCLGAVSNEEEFSSVLNDEEMDIIKNYPNYEIKFKLLEIFNLLGLQQ